MKFNIDKSDSTIQASSSRKIPGDEPRLMTDEEIDSIIEVLELNPFEEEFQRDLISKIKICPSAIPELISILILKFK